MISSFAITQRGQSHIDEGTPGQDYSLTKKTKVGEKEYIISAISDGVGSCSYSQVGSETTVTTIVNYILEEMQKKDKWDEKNLLDLIRTGYELALEAIEDKSSEMKLPMLQFDCTLSTTIYDGKFIWFGHVGDGGIVALYNDGMYEMITQRHKGEEAHSVYPIRCEEKWEFGSVKNEVASFAMMTDGVLDSCVGNETYQNRIFWPFLKPALTEIVETEEQLEAMREDWDSYLKVDKSEDDSFRKKVTDDITLLVVMNSESLKDVEVPPFDWDKWDEQTRTIKKKQDEILYKEYNEYIKNKNKKSQADQVPKKEESQPSDVINNIDDNTDSDGGDNNKTTKNSVPLTDDKISFENVIESGIKGGKIVYKAGNETAKKGIEVTKQISGKITNLKKQKSAKPPINKKNTKLENIRIDKRTVRKERMHSTDEISCFYSIEKTDYDFRVIKGKVLEGNENPDSEYFELMDKLKCLCSMNLPLIEGVLFPQGIVKEKKTYSKGFIIDHCEYTYSLADIMEGYDRDKYLPKYTMNMAMCIAYNLCSILYNLHKNGIIMGDLNPENFYYYKQQLYFSNVEGLTFSDGMNNRKFYTYNVFADILAPELMGLDMLDRRKMFSKEADYFSLAILIFWLLTDGGHPFNCVDMLSGNNRKSECKIANNECIAKGSSHYFGKKNLEKVDEKTKRFEKLPEEIQELFYRTFDYEDSILQNNTKKRATAEEWMKVLKKHIK